MTELQILSAVKNNGGCIEYVSLLNLNITDTNRDALADKARIENLISSKLLKGKAEAYCTITITDEGRLYLQDADYLEEQDKKLSEQATSDKAKENRHEWYLTIVGGLIAGIIGLAFELICFFILA